ncbi:MAG: hypothetical protein HND43_03015 [Armatimonadetes bacterium]|nr:hypothetical protein [Armatimonadota bacterium]NOG38350.1 hypothetical protein [Armatimonadota bacterium]GIK32478.1 MAG: hypothetical protein BroJett009_14700 [Armatimonadota bacterium]
MPTTLTTLIAPALAATLAAAPLEPETGPTLRRTAQPVSEMNTLYGPTGLLVIPTAFVADRNTLSFGTAFGEDLRGPSANWGAFDGIEVGGAFIDREGESNKGIVNAKINIIPENFKWFEVGVGVIDAADALEQTLYVVASADLVVPDRLKNQAIGLRGHVGAGTGMFQDKVFGGGELWLDEKFSLVGEWDTRNFNGGFRYVHDSSFRLQIGFQHTDFFLSAGYILRF